MCPKAPRVLGGIVCNPAHVAMQAILSELVIIRPVS